MVTSGERHCYRLLNELGITYQVEKTLVGKSRTVRVDCYIPQWNIAVEVDGSVHAGRKQKTLDAEKNKILTSEFGMKVVRMRNSEICNWAKEKILEVLGPAILGSEPKLYRKAY